MQQALSYTAPALRWNPTLQWPADHSPFTALRSIASAFLVLLVFSIPWEDQFVVGSIGTFSRVAGIAAFGVGVQAAMTTAQIRIPRPAHLALLVFVLWNCISYFWSVQNTTTVPAIKTYLQLLAMTWLVLEFASTPRMQLNLLRAYVLGTWVSTAGTIISLLTNRTAYWQRSVAAGFDPNDLCVIFALSIPMSFYLMVHDRSGVLSWLWRIHPVPVLFAAMLTSSRGGFIAICGALLVVPLLFRDLPRATKLLIPALAVLLIAAAILYSPAATFERLTSIPQELQSGTLGDRRIIWRAGSELFREYPIFGVGSGAFAAGVEHVLREDSVAHNAFLTVLAETGIIGAMLFATAIYLLIAPLAQCARLERRFWLVLLFTWFLGAMSLSWAHRKPTWFLFALLAVQVHRPERRQS